MKPEDRRRYPAVAIRLKDGRELRLRMLAGADEVVLGDFYESVPREDYRFYRCKPLDRKLAGEVAGRADSPTEVVLVAEEPATGAIVGYAWYSWEAAKPEKSVFGICIRRTHQGGGLAKALMTRLLSMAREVGPAVMTLTVQLANPRAVALYQAMGFKIVREQMRNEMPDFPPELEYFMEQKMR